MIITLMPTQAVHVDKMMRQVYRHHPRWILVPHPKADDITDSFKRKQQLVLAAILNVVDKVQKTRPAMRSSKL